MYFLHVHQPSTSIVDANGTRIAALSDHVYTNDRAARDRRNKRSHPTYGIKVQTSTDPAADMLQTAVSAGLKRRDGKGNAGGPHEQMEGRLRDETGQLPHAGRGGYHD